jgi:hypothetical protein
VLLNPSNYYDRVWETTVTNGTGAVTLGGARVGYRTFASVLSAGAACYYTITDGTNWEVGQGTFTGSTLTRDLVHSSSNAGSLVNFPIGVKDIWLDLPALALNHYYFPGIAQFTPPVDANFSWLNQQLTGHEDLTQPDSIYLYDDGGQGNTYQTQGRLVAIPATPYSVEMAFIPQFTIPGRSSTYVYLGMVLYDSVSLKLQRHTFMRASTGSGPLWYVRVSQQASVTAAITDLLLAQLNSIATVQWLKVTDDGVNRTYWTSVDGFRYISFYQEAHANGFFTPTNIGFFLDHYGAVAPLYAGQCESGLRVVHWKGA